MLPKRSFYGPQTKILERRKIIRLVVLEAHFMLLSALFRLKVMKSHSKPCGKQHFREIATPDWVGHFTNETYSRVWNMFVKSLPNPAWLFLGNVVFHMACKLPLRAWWECSYQAKESHCIWIIFGIGSFLPDESTLTMLEKGILQVGVKSRIFLLATRHSNSNSVISLWLLDFWYY